MLIEIHMIQNHSPANLNRDDLGAPKTCLFGGVTRARISSQCLKRSIRNPGNPDDVHNRGPGIFAKAMREYIAQRTKFFPDLVKHALAREGETRSIPNDEHEKIVRSVQNMTKEKESSQSAEDEADERAMTPQLILAERSEADAVVRHLGRLRKEQNDEYKRFLDWKWTEKQKAAKAKFLRELRKAYQRRSVDIALFGRMTTSDAFEDVEAAMQVAHAISTHAVVNEVDYWTAVDDLGKSGGGSGHLGEGMFNSACFYKYFCLDWDQLVRNLAGPEPDKTKEAEAHKKWTDEVEPQAKRLAACTLGHFIRAAAMTTPSGKQNSFASHTEPCGILVEIKKNGKHPTNYANAFAEPVERIGKPDDDAPDEKSIEGRSVACLADHVQAIRRAYGIKSTLLWYSPKLWRFPLQYWNRTEDGKRLSAQRVVVAENGKKRNFDALVGNGTQAGLVEAVIEEMDLGLKWADVADAAWSSPAGAAS